MTTRLLLVMGIADNLWLYALSVFLFLTVCFLLFQNSRLRKSASADDDYRRFLLKILDNLPFPIMVKGIQEQFKYTYWNKEAELQSDISRKSAVGFSDVDIFGGKRGKQYRKIDEDLVRAGKPYKAEERYVTTDGKVHDTLVVKSIISSGKLDKWSLVARWEITRFEMYERELLATEERLEGAARRQKLALRSIDFGLIRTGRNYKVQWEETSSIKNLVVGRHYIPGTTYYRTARRGDKPRKRCIFQEAISTGRMVRHVTHVDHVDLEVTATPVYSDTGGEIIGGLLRFKDITEKLKADRILQETKGRTEESNRLKSAPLANMNHEMHAPLDTVIGSSNLIYQADDVEEKGEYIRIVTSNNELLSQLIDDILGLSKIEAGTMDFSYALTDINKLMEGICLQVQQRNQRLGVQVLFTEKESRYVTNTDHLRLSQVIVNLTNDAMKFTTEGPVTLGCRLSGQKNKLYFFVKDTGIGIPADKAEKVFERFAKLNSFVKGMGLGLAICRVIIKRLEGTTGVDMAVEEGACFQFRLPVQEDIPLDIPISLC